MTAYARYTAGFFVHGFLALIDVFRQVFDGLRDGFRWLGRGARGLVRWLL